MNMITENIIHNPVKVIDKDRVEYYVYEIVKDIIAYMCQLKYIGFNLSGLTYAKEKILYEIIADAIGKYMKKYIRDCIYIKIAQKLKKIPDPEIPTYINYEIYYPELLENGFELEIDMNTYYRDNNMFYEIMYYDMAEYRYEDFKLHVIPKIWKYVNIYTDMLLLEEDDTIDTKPAKLIPYNT